jgi:hypothetical protein
MASSRGVASIFVDGGVHPIVALRRVANALRIVAASVANRVSTVARATRIASVISMSTAQPVILDLMREGTTDTRGLDLYNALKVENDTVASITSITVVRTDGQPIGVGDLTITPSGFSNPWVSANGAAVPNVAINWWQQVGASIASNGDVQYRITVAFTTAFGRPLEYDALQTVTETLG